MAIITGRRAAQSVIDHVREKGVSMAIFCTASHWNTEAILLAAQKFGDKYGIESVPVAVAMTCNYPHMPQAQRVTHCHDAKAGFLSILSHLDVLAGRSDSPYARVEVLPHLDHADPERDYWALTAGSPYLASAMFDAQRYPAEENRQMTADYVRRFGSDLLVEGIMEELTVAGKHAKETTTEGSYPERAERFVRDTKIDFLVADLGTEQQSAAVNAKYLKERARALTRILKKEMLVLHGTSSLADSEFSGLAADGVVRVNMWTRIARESGQYAAGKLIDRSEAIRGNDFEAAESCRYLMDSIDKASDLMLAILESLNYRNFGRRQ